MMTPYVSLPLLNTSPSGYPARDRANLWLDINIWYTCFFMPHLSLYCLTKTGFGFFSCCDIERWCRQAAVYPL